MDQHKEKSYGKKSTRIRQKNKRIDSKMESNDSPKIPDRGETSDIPSVQLKVPSSKVWKKLLNLSLTQNQKKCSH